jgi:GH24 family phage-related lysozyme (muramidase)
MTTRRLRISGPSVPNAVKLALAQELAARLPGGRVEAVNADPTLSPETLAAIKKDQAKAEAIQKAAEALVAAEKAGWVNDPDWSGADAQAALLVEARTGTILTDKDGQDIRRAKEILYVPSSSAVQTLPDEISKHEGSFQYMYLDKYGFVTIGKGHVLSNLDAATQLPFLIDSSGLAASKDQIKEDYQILWSISERKLMDVADKHGVSLSYVKENRIKKFAKDFDNMPGAAAYEKLTRVRLPAEKIENLKQRDTDRSLQELENIFHDFRTFPISAQMALMDMYFNLGFYGFRKYSLLQKAVLYRDWTNAADTCFRLGIPERRNKRTRDQFLEAAEITVFFISVLRKRKKINES